MLSIIQCPECGYEFERIQTNTLRYLVLAQRLRGIASRFGSDCPRCDSAPDLSEETSPTHSLSGWSNQNPTPIKDGGKLPA